MEGSNLVVVGGRAGSGKSVAARATALFTAETLGGAVLWIDPLGDVPRLYTADGVPYDIEGLRPETRELSADDFVERAKGKALVVIDHFQDDAGTLVAEARKLADAAGVRGLVVANDRR